MMGESLPIACLRQLPTQGKSDQRQPQYLLSADRLIAIGRDPQCQIVLDPMLYGSVSRRHVEVRPTAATPGKPVSWWICDLNSSNGTYLNGKRLRGCKVLKAGDRILLGHNGPEFIFDYQSEGTVAEPTPSRYSDSPGDATIPPAPDWTAPDREEQVTFTQLFPILSTGQDLTQKAYLVPGVITVGFVVSLFVAVGNSMAFNLLLAAYLALAAIYVVYRLCGKPKPWWILAATALATVGLLRSPLLPVFIFLFRTLLPGQVPKEGESFLVALIHMFFGAGLMEELLKVIPLLVLFMVGRLIPPPWNSRIGIWEPLDGILLGAASGMGFSLLETLGQYVPDIVQNTTLQAGDSLIELTGSHLLIARLLGGISGHVAYSGYFGYFVGLSVLKPKQSGIILLIGYLTAAGLHTLWNTMGPVSPVLLALVGGLSYAFLAASILKARSLSPTRSQNFATRLK
jgi:RsiW-degrading membrane proteinase PrsW (M82 family)